MKTLLLITTLFASSLTFAIEPEVKTKPESLFYQRGIASYYAHQFHGRTTASGEKFNMHDLTVAHRTLKFGTKVKITCEQTGKSVIAKVNDRGPFHGNRVIDLSLGTAKHLGIVQRGTAPVKIEIIK